MLVDNKYLIARDDGEPYKYSNYLREHFDRVMRALDMDHKPHECRHTFITMMKNVTILAYTHTAVDLL